MLYALIFLTIIMLFLLLCYVCFRIACVRGRKSDRTTESFEKGSPLEPYTARFRTAGEWLDKQEKQPMYVKSFDGLLLHADYIPCENSHKTLILMHGYHSSYRSDFAISLPFYRQMGFSILLADQRSHSKSEGRYITYGIFEKFDCKMWIDEIIKLSGEDEQIFLGGMSMGASTVLMTSGLDLPQNVKGIVADCGFTSGWDIVRNTAKNVNRHIPDFVIVMVNFFCRIFADFDLRDDSTLLAMQKCKTPVLFIHGTRDTFVPCEMTLRNYAACKSEKELFTVAGAGHGMSYLINEEKYKQILKAFLDKHTS